jgi:hypothetical protein
MKVCAFCGNLGGNVEHIIAQWLIERMEAHDYPVVVAHRKEDSLKSRPAHLLNTYTTKSVCDKCNSGWMSELEDWLQRNMGLLVEPTWPKLAPEVLEQALAEKEMLAKWALKTAVMMDSNAMMENIVSGKTAAELYAGRISDNVVVELAHIHERGVGGILSQGFWVRNGGRPPQWQEHKEKMAFKAVIQLNHLAVRVFQAPGANPSYYGPNGRLPLRCYPESQDPYKGDFRFHDLWEFDRVLELETWLGA